MEVSLFSSFSVCAILVYFQRARWFTWTVKVPWLARVTGSRKNQAVDFREFDMYLKFELDTFLDIWCEQKVVWSHAHTLREYFVYDRSTVRTQIYFSYCWTALLKFTLKFNTKSMATKTWANLQPCLLSNRGIIPRLRHYWRQITLQLRSTLLLPGTISKIENIHNLNVSSDTL